MNDVMMIFEGTCPRCEAELEQVYHRTFEGQAIDESYTFRCPNGHEFTCEHYADSGEWVC